MVALRGKRIREAAAASARGVPLSAEAATASQILMLTNGHATMASVGLASVRLGAARALAAQLMEPSPSTKGTTS